MAQFDRFHSVSAEAIDLRQAIADREIIGRAKGILMERTGASENEAHAKLQRLSMDRGKTVAEIASIVIDGAQVMGPEATSQSPTRRR